MKIQRHLNGFFKKVEKIPFHTCWEWIGKKSWNGYGRMIIDGHEYMAHRISYLIHNGSIEEGNLVCHTCDNRSCVNPNHLFSGHYMDNINDMISKGRNIKGEMVGTSILKSEQVLEIRRRLNDGESGINIAKEFKVGHQTIYKIKNRSTWKHL